MNIGHCQEQEGLSVSRLLRPIGYTGIMVSLWPMYRMWADQLVVLFFVNRSWLFL